MSDMLAIVGEPRDDERILADLEKRHPTRVTVLIEDATVDWARDDSSQARAVRDRLPRLLHLIERRTGAVVVGLAGSRDQLVGWRFDRIIGGQDSLRTAA